MVSKTSLAECARAFDWPSLKDGLTERPDLLNHRDDRGRGWLHLCCGSPPNATRTAADSVRAVDLLLGLGLGLDDPAFTEGEWKATPLWYAVAHGRNLVLAEHLLGRGCDPDYALFAAAWNNDRPAIRLLIRHGASVEDDANPHETPLLGAVGWSRFGPAEELLLAGADPDARDAKGRTALHLMLKKGSAPEHFEMFVAAGARGDIADGKGRTAIDILRRKKDPAYRAIAERLARGSA